MSLSTIKFMGASFRDASISLGWGQNSTSTAVITVVEDTVNGDNFVNPGDGTPITFGAGSLSFRGLIQKQTKSVDTRGGERYEITLVDPRVLLQKTQLILGGYSGAVFVRNLVNVYGYWESTGFGNSGATEGGVPFSNIRNALVQIINSGIQSTYGGPIYYRGNSYSINLSELPEPPNYYRIPNTGSISLFDFISQICDDAGHEFYVTLVGHTITIKTRSHIDAPPLGTISSFIEANASSNISSYTYGTELRDAESTRFLVGGQQQVLNTQGSLHGYYGNDINGNPVLAQQAKNVLIDSSGTLVAHYESEFANVNAAPVADAIGTTSYKLTEIEMQAALFEQSAWLSYIGSHKQDLARKLKIPYYQRNQDGQAASAFEMVMPEGGTSFAEETNAYRMFEFVRGFAQNFYGKKYAVKIPGLSIKIDPESLVKTYSHEPADGGWAEEGSNILGLSLQDEDVFKLNDGKFGPFVKYAGLTSGVNYTQFNPADTVWSTDSFSLSGEINSMFTKCSLDRDQVIFYNNEPYVLITLPAAMQFKDENMFGGGFEWFNAYMSAPPSESVHATMSGVFQDIAFIGQIGGGLPSALGAAAIQAVNEEETLQASRRSFGALAFAVSPKKIKPSAAAIPLKSNILTYGPWHVSGPEGSKVRYEQDTNLTPWNYGGYDEMELAALAKITNAATDAEIVESGSVEQGSLPLYNIGDVMIANGPNITNININARPEGGFTTTYRFESYTPRRGNLFNNNLPENIRRIGQNNQNIRRELRAAQNEQKLRQQVQNEARGSSYLHRLPPEFQNASPKPMIVSQIFTDSDGNAHIGTSLMTRGEANATALLQSEETWNSHAMEDLAGLMIPVSKNGSGDLPNLNEVTDSNIEVRSALLHNYQNWGVDIAKPVEWISVGSSYSGLSTYNNYVENQIANDDDIRFIANRAPLMLCGWGYNLSGQIIGKDAYPDSYHQEPTAWKAGPVDFLWDDYRGIWSCHGFLRCKLQDSLSLSGEALAHILDGNGHTHPEWPIRVKLDYDTTASSGDKVGVQFDPYAAAWYVTSAECADS